MQASLMHPIPTGLSQQRWTPLLMPSSAASLTLHQQRQRLQCSAALRQQHERLQQQRPLPWPRQQCCLQMPLQRQQHVWQQHHQQQQQQRSTDPAAEYMRCRAAGAAAAASFPDDASSGSSNTSSSSAASPLFAGAARLAAAAADTARDLRDLLLRFVGLWRSFLPMLSLFFCLSFINTMLDSLKDTLVITAAGGGAFVIPYLTVYAVLPISVAFLVGFSAASLRFSRSTLFNAIVAGFIAFFAAFALFLYPNADVLHPHALADQLQAVLPQGLAGAVGMFRNWTFTLFFCMSELWGDVCMGLLFWGLANEITNLSDAATLYPLFGLGANLAQALAGMVLKATTCCSGAEFGRALQLSMAAVVLIAAAAIALQQHITSAAEAAAAARRQQRPRHNSVRPPGRHSQTTASVSLADSPEQQEQQKPKRAPSVLATFRVLAGSLEIRCLATMSLAQGLCNSLMEFAWKCHMRILYPSPADFTAFLGDVATWSGVVTGSLMLLSPLLFERLGWRGVASVTPNMLLWGGSGFFVACIAYQHLFGATVAAGGAAAAGPGAMLLLQGLVLSGALLYVFGRGAKFSLFKPAEEMVYITLDEDGRTRGKAAIDVVGSQTGKSGGSLLQQALLLASAGSITGIMPVMFGVFFLMLRGWKGAVADLSAVRHYSYDSPVTSMDEEDGEAVLSQQQQQQLAQQLAQLAAAHGASSSSSNASVPGDEEGPLAAAGAGAGAAGAGSPLQPSKSFQAAFARSGSGSTSDDNSSRGHTVSVSDGAAEQFAHSVQDAAGGAAPEGRPASDSSSSPASSGSGSGSSGSGSSSGSSSGS